MKGDFTRDTFDPLKHFSQVLMQQGRVTLEADFNEQASILRHHARKVARDIIGPYAAPAIGGGFLLAADPDGLFSISKGHYYVDGILVENDTDKCTYRNQPDFPVPKDDVLVTAPGAMANAPRFWIYLDVWEQHVTSLDDDSIREKALNGPDTCTRARVVWQVKALPETEQLRKDLDTLAKQSEAETAKRYTARISLQKQFDAATDADKLKLYPQIQAMDDDLARFHRFSRLPLHEKMLSQLVPLSTATMAARVDPGLKTENACVTPPDSKYRGLENQLYRIEVHHGGTVGNANGTPGPTFKWSRDNGSVVTAWLGGTGNDLQVVSTRGFAAGNWIELTDDSAELLGKAGVLFKLAKVEGDTLSVDPATTLPARTDFPSNPKVRRWDHGQKNNTVSSDGTVKIQEAAAGTKLWIDLEDGLQIQFTAGGDYRTGDYWLIPARVATGKIEWPGADDLNPQPLPPRGVQHHYALLGSVAWANNQLQIENQRCVFWPLLTSATASTATINSHVVVGPFGSPAPAHGPDVATKPVTKPKRTPHPKTPPVEPNGTPA